MSQIYFKKLQSGRWRRDDGELKKIVEENVMYNEVQKLYAEGWKVETHGVNFLRGITLTKG